MKVLIATGIYPPDLGGPAQYARGVEEVWKKEGHTVKVLSFRFERKLPTGIRHFYYFLRVLFSLPGVDFVFSPDTFSAALPALLACKLFRKKLIIRTGGDFLWESYVERTGELVLLKDFYATSVNKFNGKERIVFALLKSLFRHADAIIFSTAWQRDIFEKPYGLNRHECPLVENFYGPQKHSDILQNMRMSKKVFVGGARELRWKNLPRVEEAFKRVQEKDASIVFQLQTSDRAKFLQDIQSSYAVIVASLGDISPNTILEAIQYGKPFILTRETGLYEKLKDIGVWVNPESVEDIAEKIRWLADEENYKEQCRKIEAFAFTHSYEEIADEILQLYADSKS
ncbi:MAG: glycosyltransferase [Candidatus Taylorbacteria bacterium]|nr:glycosyltransferase [Candidatus Taylorbacteria bacterium]